MLGISNPTILRSTTAFKPKFFKFSRTELITFKVLSIPTSPPAFFYPGRFVYAHDFLPVTCRRMNPGHRTTQEPFVERPGSSISSGQTPKVGQSPAPGVHCIHTTGTRTDARSRRIRRPQRRMANKYAHAVQMRVCPSCEQEWQVEGDTTITQTSDASASEAFAP